MKITQKSNIVLGIVENCLNGRDENVNRPWMLPAHGNHGEKSSKNLKISSHYEIYTE